MENALPGRGLIKKMNFNVPESSFCECITLNHQFLVEKIQKWTLTNYKDID